MPGGTGQAPILLPAQLFGGKKLAEVLCSIPSCQAACEAAQGCDINSPHPTPAPGPLSPHSKPAIPSALGVALTALMGGHGLTSRRCTCSSTDVAHSTDVTRSTITGLDLRVQEEKQDVARTLEGKEDL